MASIDNIITEGPFIRSYIKQNVLQTVSSTGCTGFIANVTLSGGTAPYTIDWTGPGAYTADTINISNLCAGTYSGTVTDSLFTAHTSFITVAKQFAPTLSATTIDDSCTTNINNFCKIKVHSFDHSQGEFTYILYMDGNIYRTYIGQTGEEIHTFSDLPMGNYTLSGYDGVAVDETYLLGGSKCSDGAVVSSDSIGGTVVVLTGLTPTTILEEWDRASFLNIRYFIWQFNWGPNQPAVSVGNITIPTGMIPGGHIEVDNPRAWFYTGSTRLRQTDPFNVNEDWYLGTFNTEMREGDSIGPTLAAIPSQIGKFYYNSFIKKFLVWWVYNTDTVPNSYVWMTYNATKDYGPGTGGNPASTLYAISGNTDFYTTTALTTAEQHYSVTGGTNDTISWAGVAPGNSVLELGGAGASGLAFPIVTLSPCEYTNYVHEVCIGSTGADNDRVGIVLAAFKDVLGLYGQRNMTHNIVLNFVTSSITSGVRLDYNYRNEIYAFTESTSIPYCGDMLNPCQTISGTSSLIGARPASKSPFSVADYDTQGSARIKIERSGTVGEVFRIQMTDTLLLADVGTPNPYNPTYEINLNLLNPTTWTGETTSAPTYAKTDDLVKFLGATKIGYFQSSQPETHFYHMSFTGAQSNTIGLLGGYGASATELFPLYNATAFGVDMSTSTTADYYSSIGGGGEVGKPTVPRVTAMPALTMETIISPKVRMLTGGTKINSTDPYTILDPSVYNGTTLLPLVFEYYKDTTNLLNDNTLVYYTIHGYNNENKKFNTLPEYTRILTQDISPTYTRLEDNEIIGESIIFSDEMPFITTSNEYLIKTNSYEKDKLRNIATTPSNVVINPLLPCEITGSPISNTWLDTFVTQIDPNKEYGGYDEETDFYFTVLPSTPNINLDTKALDFGEPQGCTNLYNEAIIIPNLFSGDSGSYSGLTGVLPPVIKDKPYSVVLNFQPGGDVQVTLNGATLIEGDTLGDPDFFRRENTITFPPNTIEVNDKINFFYVPIDTSQAYTVNTYIVPPTVVVITGETTPYDTLYDNGYYYYYKFSTIPEGAIGAVLNGTILHEGSDFTRIARNLIRFNYLISPTEGFKSGDIISYFFFSIYNLSGVATVKNPTIIVVIETSAFYSPTLILTIYDEEETVVQQTSKSYKGQEINSQFINNTPNRSTSNGYTRYQIDFKVEVPKPGKYHYNITCEVGYTLLLGEKIYNSSISPTLHFEMSSSIFYLDNEDTRTNDATLIV